MAPAKSEFQRVIGEKRANKQRNYPTRIKPLKMQKTTIAKTTTKTTSSSSPAAAVRVQKHILHYFHIDLCAVVNDFLSVE